MKLDISRLRTGVEPVDRRYPPEAFDGADDQYRVVGETTLDGTVRRDGRSTVVLTGRVRSTLEAQCGRCLEPFLVPVDATVETRFVPPEEFARVTADTVRSGEMDGGEVEGADLGLAEYADETLDLAGVMKEQFLLALPMKPLCTQDCLGLCPVCGVNRNRDACECRHEWVDPRFAALAELKDRNKG